MTEPNPTTTERKSDLEFIVTRTFNGPAHLVYKAWTTPELLLRWWVPKSSGAALLSCELDARTGGQYRFEFAHPSFDQPMIFFGKYLDVVPNARLVWTNEESEDGAVSTLTLEEKDGRTRLTLSELYPTKDAADRALEMLELGDGVNEQHVQLDDLLVELAA